MTIFELAEQKNGINTFGEHCTLLEAQSVESESSLHPTPSGHKIPSAFQVRYRVENRGKDLHWCYATTWRAWHARATVGA